VDVPRGWQTLEQRQIGPFVTSVRLLRPDGTEVRFSAWHHRKGHGLVEPVGERAPNVVQWWAPAIRGWWIAVLFMIGSACFAVGSFPLTADILGEAALPIFFVGSIFFTSAAYLQFYEAANEGDDIEGRGRTGRLFGLRTHSIGWWAAAVQLVGTLWFNLTTFSGMLDLTTRQAEVLVWAPDAIGSICFLVASGLALLEVHDGIAGLRPVALEAKIATSNMLGSIAFGISAIAAVILPASGELLNAWAANVFTFIGAALFFVGAWLLIPDLRPEAGSEAASSPS
jgi:hypothetical protein